MAITIKGDGTVIGLSVGGLPDGIILDEDLATGISASKLTGTFGPVSGSSLTNLPTEITKQSSDPTISTNPSGGVGIVILNTTSGEMFICTDATTNANVWTNVGGGSGDIQLFSVQGSISGYTVGGYDGSNTNVIDKFSFTTDGNATDVGDLTAARYVPIGQISTTHGYTSGGVGGSPSNIIERFSFTTDGNATDVGDLTIARSGSGQSSSTHGYVSGGDNTSTNNVNSGINVIEKYAYLSSSNGTDVGDLTVTRTALCGTMDLTHGYANGGRIGGVGATRYNTIDRFAFSSDGNATDVGDLTVISSGRSPNGQNSLTHSYLCGGEPANSRIEKYQFASSSNSTNIATLVTSTDGQGGQSSTTSGYCSGGSPSVVNVIQKFSFTSDSNSTDVGDLTTARQWNGGCSY